MKNHRNEPKADRKRLRPPPSVSRVKGILSGLDTPVSDDLICDIHSLLHRHMRARETARRIDPSITRGEIKAFSRQMRSPIGRRMPLTAHKISLATLRELLINKEGREKITTTARKVYKRLLSPPRGPQKREDHNALLITLITSALDDHGITVDGRFDRITAEPKNCNLKVVFDLVKLIYTNLTWHGFRNLWNSAFPNKTKR